MLLCDLCYLKIETGFHTWLCEVTHNTLSLLLHIYLDNDDFNNLSHYQHIHDSGMNEIRQHMIG